MKKPMNGHGYGFHTAVLDAKYLGGKLEASSAGPGKGATFSLTLPKMQIEEVCYEAGSN